MSFLPALVTIRGYDQGLLTQLKYSLGNCVQSKSIVLASVINRYTLGTFPPNQNDTTAKGGLGIWENVLGNYSLVDDARSDR